MSLPPKLDASLRHPHHFPNRIHEWANDSGGPSGSPKLTCRFASAGLLLKHKPDAFACQIYSQASGKLRVMFSLVRKHHTSSWYDDPTKIVAWCFYLRKVLPTQPIHVRSPGIHVCLNHFGVWRAVEHQRFQKAMICASDYLQEGVWVLQVPSVQRGLTEVIERCHINHSIGTVHKLNNKQHQPGDRRPMTTARSKVHRPTPSNIVSALPG